MLRMAQSPITIPDGVDVNISGQKIKVKGKLGEMNLKLHDFVVIKQVDNTLNFAIGKNIDNKQIKFAWSQAGTARANVNNCVVGVSNGFEKRLNLVGVGYRVSVKGKNLDLQLGYSHPIIYPTPEGITFATPTQTEIVIKGYDKQKVGQTAAEIRAHRPPEPYKGKGVCYVDEQIFRKEAKKK